MRLVIVGALSAAVLLVSSVFAATIVPGDNLVIDGIPPIAKESMQEVSRYTEFRGATFLGWHPHQEEILISTRFGETPQIHRVKTPGGARTQLTFSSEVVASARFDAQDGKFMVFRHDTGGNEWHQNYRLDFASGKITRLTDGGKSKNYLGVWSNSRKLMAYGSNRRNSKDSDLYVINPRDPKSDRLLAQLNQGDSWFVLDWSPDDKQILALQYVSINESYLWLFDSTSGEKKLLTPQLGTEKVSYDGGARFTKDGKSIVVVSDRDAEFLRLGLIELSSGKFRPLSSHVSWDVEGFDLSHDGNSLAYVVNENGSSVLHLLDMASKKDQLIDKVPLGVISNLQWHHKKSIFGFNLSSARSPTDVFSYSVANRALTRWTMSETAGLNAENFVEPRLVQWESFDKRNISGFLYTPPKEFTGKRPVAVVIHGGPEGQSRPGFMGAHNYFLNELGVALIFPNIRGSTGFGKKFTTLDNGYLRVDSYKDIAALLDWIKGQSDLDAERILVTGGSYGGHVTLAVATMYNDKIAASLDVVGMSNLVTFLQNTEAYRQDLRRVEYGDERIPEMRAFLESIAPINHAKNITKPLFVVQGLTDPRVPASEAEQMVATVKANKTPVWYLAAKDEGHGFVKKKNREFLLSATVEFMKQFLLASTKAEK
jgi:dipeptidyl aminopeptidase/acylaminoacyl peptidase